MRLRRLSVVAAVVSLVLVVTACGRSAPEITDDQVEAWRALGEEMIPAATEIEFEEDLNITMLGSSDGLSIKVTFATFADLNSGYRAVAHFGSAVDEQASDRWVSTHLELTGNETFEADAGSYLQANVPGLAHVYVNSVVRMPPTTNIPTMSVSPYLYLDDPEIIDSTWMDKVVDLTQQLASDAGGRLSGVVILPSDAANLDIYGSEIEERVIPIRDLPTFTESAAHSGCVRTDKWAYDVTNDWVIVHPLGEPDGACA